MPNRLSMYIQPEEIVGGILENNDHQILLTLQPKWDKKKYLCFVGGHVEESDRHFVDGHVEIKAQTLKTALYREIWEEVQLDPTRCDPIGESGPNQSSNLKFFARNMKFYDFLCHVNNPDFHLKPGGEIERAIWVLPEDSYRYLLDDHWLIIKRLLEEGKLTEQPSGEREAVGSR